jgi:hypothetical protein
MSEPSLRQVQQLLRAAIRSPERRAAGDALHHLAAFLNPQRGVAGTARLAVYAEGLIARTRQALAEVYAAVHHVLGERAFTELARAYAHDRASADYNLSCVGRDLPEFLRAWPRTQRLPFLPDVAQLEWRVNQAFHAVEQPPQDPRDLHSLSREQWGQARLIFQPSVSAVASDWPILDIWAARATPRGQINIDLVNRPQRVLIFRQGLEVRCELLDWLQHALLAGLLAGRPLEAVCREAESRFAGATAQQGDAREAVGEASDRPLAGTVPLPAPAGLAVVGSPEDAGQRRLDAPAASPPLSEGAAAGGPSPVSEGFAHWTRLGLIVRCELLPA